MSLKSSSERTKRFEVFHLLTKNECAAEMKITKLYAFHFTSGPVDRSLARFTNNTKQKFPIYPKTFPRNQRGRPPPTTSFSNVIIVFCCSSQEGEKKKIKTLRIQPATAITSSLTTSQEIIKFSSNRQ